jgi:hypothetical protein
VSYVSKDEKSATANRSLRRHKISMVLAAGAVVGGSLVAMSASSGAATKPPLPKSLAMFAHCPISNSKVSACLYASTGGTFLVGKVSLTLPSPAILTLGLVNTSSGGVKAVAPTDGTAPLVAPTTEVPVAGNLVEVGATPTLGALPTLNLVNLLGGKGVSTVLPLIVDLSNPLLGSTCTLGTTAAPLVVSLTDGTTDPPAPNKPESGNKGTLTSTNSGLLTDSGVSLVDNAFSSPGVSGCGAFGLLDPAVDAIEGLPSAAGNNNAELSGTVYTAPASLIRKYAP